MDNLEQRINDINLVDNKWGMPLKDLYRLGLNFYKGEGTSNETQTATITSELEFPVKQISSICSTLLQ